MGLRDEPKQPDCQECGHELGCRSCNDIRPKAEELYPGWTLRTPMGTWERVLKVEHDSQYSPIFVWTDEHPTWAWEYTRWRKVDAAPPRIAVPGKPEIRYMGDSRDTNSLWVVVTQDTQNWGWGIPDSEYVLAQAGCGNRLKGWWIQQRQDGTAEHTPGGGHMTHQGISKAEARSTLKRLGKEYAKALGIPFRVDQREAR